MEFQIMVVICPLFRPIRVSPLSIIRFFGTEGQRILVSELVWIWIPAVVCLFVIRFIKSQKNSNLLKNETLK